MHIGPSTYKGQQSRKKVLKIGLKLLFEGIYKYKVQLKCVQNHTFKSSRPGPPNRDLRDLLVTERV